MILRRAVASVLTESRGGWVGNRWGTMYRGGGLCVGVVPAHKCCIETYIKNNPHEKIGQDFFYMRYQFDSSTLRFL